MRAIVIIARTVLQESLRTRLWLVYSLVLLVCLGAAWFAGQLTLTDSERTRIIVLATLLRPLLAAQLVLHIAAAVHREVQERGLDMLLAAGLPVHRLILGRLLGYSLMAAMMGLGAGVALFAMGAQPELLNWVIGLVCELSLLAALSLAVSIAFRQVASSALATAAFYVLGHSLGAILLMARHPLASPGSADAFPVQWPVEAIAWLIPRLDLFGSADWLAGLRPGHLLPVLLQTMIYLFVLFAVTALDLKRKREPA